MGRDKEKQGICGDMQVEIHQAMNQHSTAGDQTRQVQYRTKRAPQLSQALQRIEQYKAEKPGAANSADHACFGERFHIVVVRMIHDLAVIECFVRREHDLKRPESSAKEGMV